MCGWWSESEAVEKVSKLSVWQLIYSIGYSVSVNLLNLFNAVASQDQEKSCPLFPQMLEKNQLGPWRKTNISPVLPNNGLEAEQERETSLHVQTSLKMKPIKFFLNEKEMYINLYLPSTPSSSLTLLII